MKVVLITLLGQTFKDTYSDRPKRFWKWLIGGSGSVIGLLLLCKNFLGWSIMESVLWGVVIIGSIYLILFFCYFVINTIQYAHHVYKDSIYGEAIIVLRDSFSKIHSLRKNEIIEDKDFIETMSFFCNNLKHIFDGKTKKSCSVSIKVPIKGKLDETALVYNLCRDSVATKIRDTDIYKKTDHNIIGNTAFQMVLNNIFKGNKGKLHYINNNINASKDYQNTSKDAYPNGQLLYDSELVYPIIPFDLSKSLREVDCLGFICIDSVGTNCFDEKYDVAIISGVADGIYDLIKLRNQQNESKA